MGKIHLQVRQSSRQFSTNHLIFCGISFKNPEKYMTSTRPVTQSHTLTPQQNGGTISIRDLVKGCVCIPVVDKHRHRVLLKWFVTCSFIRKTSLSEIHECIRYIFIYIQLKLLAFLIFWTITKHPTKKNFEKKGAVFGKKQLQEKSLRLPKCGGNRRRGVVFGYLSPLDLET